MQGGVGYNWVLGPFQHENMHSYFFSLNYVILKPRIYSQLRYLQLLGNQFGKKTKLRMWCTFCVKIAKSHGFVTRSGGVWMRPILQADAQLV